MNIPLSQLIPILQLATGPVILISGIGLLLLSFTNRLGRLIDRSRHLYREKTAQPDRAQLAHIEEQIALLDRRADLLRRVITLAGTAVLLVSVLILVLFLSVLFHVELGLLLIALFAPARIRLIASMIGFLREIHLSLEAVRLETKM